MPTELPPFKNILTYPDKFIKTLIILNILIKHNGISTYDFMIILNKNYKSTFKTDIYNGVFNIYKYIKIEGEYYCEFKQSIHDTKKRYFKVYDENNKFKCKIYLTDLGRETYRRFIKIYTRYDPFIRSYKNWKNVEETRDKIYFRRQELLIRKMLNEEIIVYNFINRLFKLMIINAMTIKQGYCTADNLRFNLIMFNIYLSKIPSNYHSLDVKQSIRKTVYDYGDDLDIDILTHKNIPITKIFRLNDGTIAFILSKEGNKLLNVLIKKYLINSDAFLKVFKG
jgi:hypothetical protein